MIDSLGRSADDEVPVPGDADVAAVREFFRTWSGQPRVHLESQQE